MISNCPRCDEPLRIPSESLPADAYAKCPWCHETYPLQEALRHLPPMLTIIGVDGREISGSSRAGMALSGAGHGSIAYAPTPSQLNRQDDRDFDDDLDGSVTFDTSDSLDDASGPMRIEVGDDELDPAFVIQDASGSQSVAPMRVQPLPPLKSSTSKRKKKSSPLKSLIGIALGPIIAIPAAAGILLALDHFGIKEAPNLGVWPMDGSYSSSTWNSPTAAAPLSNVSEPNPSPGRTQPPTGRSLAEELGTTPDAPTDDPAADALAQITDEPISNESATEEPATAESATEESNETSILNDTATVAVPSIDPPSIESPSIEPPTIEPPSIAAPQMESPATEVSSIDVAESTVTMPEASDAEVAAPEDSQPSVEVAKPEAPQLEPTTKPQTELAVYAPEVVAARFKATEMLDELANLDSDDAHYRRVLAGTYIALAEVSSLLDSENAPAAQDVIDKLKADDALLGKIAGATSEWLKLSANTRPSPGVVVIGELERSGDTAKIRLANDRLITVDNADPSLPQGKVIGLGKIVEAADGQSVQLPLIESL